MHPSQGVLWRIIRLLDCLSHPAFKMACSCQGKPVNGEPAGGECLKRKRKGSDTTWRSQTWRPTASLVGTSDFTGQSKPLDKVSLLDVDNCEVMTNRLVYRFGTDQPQ